MNKIRSRLNQITKPAVVFIFALQTLIPIGSTAYAADSTPPASIVDLGTEQTSATSIKLSWTAPGNDGNVGTASSYEIRYYKEGLVTDQTWSAATVVSGAPSPAIAGTQQTFTVTGLAANTRYWFGIKTSDGTNVSAISNSPANLVTDMSQVNVWAFDQTINNSRERALTRIIQPDIIHRGIYEWAGTELMDHNYDGMTSTLQRLTKDGSVVSAGVSAYWWAPKYETLAPGVNVNEAGYDPDAEWNNIDSDTASGKTQLEYKAKRQIDLGVMGIEFDEMYKHDNAPSIMQDVRNYAWNTYGKKIFVSANGYWGGTGVADYNILYYPMPTDANDRFDASVNNIANLKSQVASSSVPVMWFQDFAGGDTTGPYNAADYPAYLRSGNAQGLAAGGFPGQLKSWMNSYDTFQNGVFAIQANHFKFMRENGELWHNLTQLNPTTLSTTASNVFLSALGQTGRTILHLVNGNFNASTQVMTPKTNFTAKISLATAPTRIWLTTPDKLSNVRKQTLSYTYSGGVATITVPTLDYHDVIVIEQGAAYDPIYSAMKVIFPFPNPTNISVGNNFKFIAVQNEGFSSTFNWQVNGIAGGNATVGTIDGNGVYTAPSSIPSGGKVTIKAVSKDDATVSAQVDVNIIGAMNIPWTETFASDTVGTLPATWQVVEGNGDWKVDTDGGTTVLHNYNMSEGRVEQFQTGAGGTLSGALHEPMLVGGNANWTDYNYSVSVKPLKTPYTWMGVNLEKADTYAGLVFRYKDSRNYYVYRWAQDNYIRLYKVVNGIESAIGTPQSVPFLPTGSYTNLSVNVNGQNFTAYVNGVAVRSDVDNSITQGSVGVISNLMENDFKNISVNTASAPVTVPVGNYVVNAGFESGAISSWGTNGAATVANSNAHTGSYAGKIAVAGNNLEQTITGLSPNTTYTLTGWGKAPSGGSVWIGVKDFGGTEVYQQISSVDYTQAQVTFTTGNTDTSALIYAWEPSGTNKTVYVDDFAVQQPSVNNSGFETGAISPWTTNGTATVVNSNAHSGTYAGKITVADNNLEQTITGLSPNTTYTLTGWAKAPSGGTVWIGVKDFGGTEVYQQISSAGYTQAQVTFTTGSTDTSALIYAWEPSGASNTVYVDDFAVKPSPVSNSGFEAGTISPWTTNGTATVVSSNAHTGSYAGKITVAGNNLEQTITGLSPNTTYTLTGWAKAPSGGTVWIGVKNFGGTEVYQQISSAGYTQAQVTFTTGSTDTSALIYAWEPNGTSNTVYVDDLNIS